MNKQEREELVIYRITKARETFKEVKLHIENELWNTAVNRFCWANYFWEKHKKNHWFAQYLGSADKVLFHYKSIN